MAPAQPHQQPGPAPGRLTLCPGWPTGWLVGALLGWCVAAAPVQAQAVAPLPVQALAPGLYVHQGQVADWTRDSGGDVANLGFVVGQRCVAVIDTGGTPAVGQGLLAAVRAVTPLPVCYVINTHVHPDHILGNSAFASAETPPPQFVGHTRLAQALAARDSYLRNALARDFGINLPADGLVYPTIGVSQRLMLDLGGRSLQLDAWPTAHTNNDLTVLDTRTGTLFTSDLLFRDHLPVLDGNLKGWLAALAELRQWSVALVVPGHGAPSRDWPAVILPQLQYLQQLMRDTQAALKRRDTLSQAVAQVGLDPAVGWQLVDNFHRRNVTAAYTELEWDQ